jgi:glycosyltransferase involved in cell wall biosynthesis
MSSVTNNIDVRRVERPRLLMTAYHYDRAHSMESRLSWQRAQHAAEEFDVTVICALGESGVGSDRVTVVELPASQAERALMARTETYYLAYRLWQRRVYRRARRLHRERPFDVVHQVSFCGYREPSDCWRLGAPFVWGPVGGTRPFPRAFLRELDLRGAVREVLRNIVNDCQLRFGLRVRRAMHSASVVMSANREIARDLQRRFGVEPRVQLETGISQLRTAPRPRRDETAPLKILWAGRLRSWKGLPLLLKGLAALPAECRYTLRVLGEGSSRERWQRLAERLGIAANIEWAAWPPYAGQLPHYDWADVFAFTSLRDTSGTGLLEAIAAGAPIIGLDHQGAADIMTEACAVRVPAINPRAAIDGFRDAIARLAGDADDLARLSAGAMERAAQFHWDRQWDVMRQVYAGALRLNDAIEAAAASAADRPAARREPAALFPVIAPQEALQ